MSDTKQIYELMPMVMESVGAVGKNQTNSHQHYQFRGIDDLANAVSPALREHGVTLEPQVLEHSITQIKSARGTAMMHAIVKEQFSFFAPDGSSIVAVTIGEGMDSGDKATSKAMSAALKYALVQSLVIATRDQSDSEHDSPRVGTKTDDGPSDAALEIAQRARVAETLGQLGRLVEDAETLDARNQKWAMGCIDKYRKALAGPAVDVDFPVSEAS